MFKSLVIIRDALRARPSVFLGASFICYTLFFAINNAALAVSYFSLSVLSFTQKIFYFLGALYAVESTFTTSTFVFIILISLLQGIVITLTYHYFSGRYHLLKKHTSGGIIGLVIASVGVHCVACGGVFLSLLVSLGFPLTFFTLLPWGGKELLVASSLILLYIICTMTKKVEKVGVC